jgi:hypothetical protein
LLVYSALVSSRKILCVVSLTSFIGLAIALVVASEVRAGDEDPGDAAGVIDADTLEQAGAFTGEYRFVGGQKERDGVDAAIEKSVAELNPVVRGLGRSRLAESNEVPADIEITLASEVVTIHQAGDAHAAPVDGTKVKSKSKDGDKVKVSHRLGSGKLTQRIVGDGGERTNRYELSSDGKRLTLEVEITSSQLPVPVEYSLSYERR